MSQAVRNDGALGHLMERNVLEVFGQRDPERRKVAIGEIYAENCTFFDAGEPAVVGRDALSKRVEGLLEGAPGFVFRIAAPAQVNHDHGRVRWQFGPPGAAPVVTGMDVAIFENDRIKALYTFVDDTPSK